MTESELKGRADKLDDKEFARQCWELLFDVEYKYCQKIYTFFRKARDGKAELDKPSLERAQGCARAAIEDLQKLDKALEAKKESI